MINAKEEFIEHVKNREVSCASLQMGKYSNDKEEYLLPPGFSDEEYQTFLNAIDFEYNNGHGSQELYGHIWYTDGSWSSRGEYDGSEWWEYIQCPEY